MPTVVVPDFTPVRMLVERFPNVPPAPAQQPPAGVLYLYNSAMISQIAVESWQIQLDLSNIEVSWDATDGNSAVCGNGMESLRTFIFEETGYDAFPLSI